MKTPRTTVSTPQWYPVTSSNPAISAGGPLSWCLAILINGVPVILSQEISDKTHFYGNFALKKRICWVGVLDPMNSLDPRPWENLLGTGSFWCIGSVMSCWSECHHFNEAKTCIWNTQRVNVHGKENAYFAEVHHVMKTIPGKLGIIPKILFHRFIGHM